MQRSEDSYLEAHQEAHTPPEQAQAHQEKLVEATAAQKEIERRETQRVREAADQAIEHPGQHITEIIGERDQAADRENWERAANRLEAYHQTYQPDTPEIQAPEHRASLEEHKAFEQVKDAVTRARGDEDWRKLIPQPSLDRAIHLDRGPDLGIDYDMGR